MTTELLELLAAERDRLDQQLTDLRGMRGRLHDCVTEAHHHDGSGSSP
ncbi:hypothetical protein ACFVUW_05010 [Streptomyces xiamenensis]